MMNSAQIMVWLIGGTIAAILIGYAMWALFGDTAKGRPRCPKCGHLSGDSDELRCPECGHTVAAKKDLLKPRRHWGRASTALGLLFLSAMLVNLQTRPGGLISMLPGQVLVWSIALDGQNGPGKITNELKRRLLNQSLPDHAFESLMNRMLDGDSAARPGSREWQLRYGQLAVLFRDRVFAEGDPAADRLLSVMPAIEINAPDNWPSDQPVPAMLSMKDWWPLGTEAMLMIRSANTGEIIDRIGMRNYSTSRRPHPITLPPTDEFSAGSPMDLELAIRTRRPIGEWSREDLSARDLEWTEWNEQSILPIQVDLPLDGAFDLEPISDPEIDEAVRAIFAPGLRRWKGVRRPFAIRFDTRVANQPNVRDILIGTQVEIVERLPEGEERIRRRSHVWAAGNEGGQVISGWTLSQEDTAGLARRFDPENRNDWLMRIRSDHSLAVRALAQAGGDPSAYRGAWSGMVEFPLRVGEESSRTFIRQWFNEDGPIPPN